MLLACLYCLHAGPAGSVLLAAGLRLLHMLQRDARVNAQLGRLVL
jgi:hypothetical protein